MEREEKEWHKDAFKEEKNERRGDKSWQARPQGHIPDGIWMCVGSCGDWGGGGGKVAHLTKKHLKADANNSYQ